MSGNERVDRLASIASVAGTFTVDEIEIAKKIYVRMLTDDTSTTELEGTRMTEFEIKCGSRRECLRGKKIIRANNQRYWRIRIYTNLLRGTE